MNSSDNLSDLISVYFWSQKTIIWHVRQSDLADNDLARNQTVPINNSGAKVDNDNDDDNGDGNNEGDGDPRDAMVMMILIIGMLMVMIIIIPNVAGKIMG